MAGFLDFLRNNSDTLMTTGAGLLGGQTAQGQMAGAAQGLVQAGRQNKTLNMLRQANPELAQAVESGALSGNDAFKLYYAQKMAAEKPKNLSFQQLDNGDYGSWDGDTGQFTRLGTAPKPKDSSDDVYGQRETAAAKYGLTPDDPAYKSYMLSGKMPREDQAPLTATDKKAIFEADEMVQASQAAIPLLQKALELNDQAYSGFAAGTRGALTGAFGNESGQATQELDNVVTTQALGQMKAIFGGNPTEGERAILLDVAGSSNLPPEVRKGIYERAMQAVQRRLGFYQQRADEMRGGTYFKPGDRQQAPNSGNRTATGTTWKVVD